MIEVELPVMEAVSVSVALMVWEARVLSAAGKVAVPLVNVESDGRPAKESVLVKCAVPEYLVTTIFEESRAVTVKLKAVPMVAVAGATTAKRVGTRTATRIEFELPMREGATVSVAVMVWEPPELSVAENCLRPLSNGALAGRAAFPSLLANCTVPE
jgi:hypothetical protein